MSIEVAASIAIILAVAGLALLFILARRAVRLFVRLALAGVMIIVMIVGAVVSWWYVSNGASTSQGDATRPSNPRRAPIR